MFVTAPTMPARYEAGTATAQSQSARPGLSRLSWARLRLIVTVSVFVAATVLGVSVGVRAVDLSPVAPTVALPPLGGAAQVAPTTSTDAGRAPRPDLVRDRRAGRGGRSAGGSR